MDVVTSRDGTPIAYETAGSGPVIVFTTGAFNDHSTAAPLAAALADGFTVVTYDRRAPRASGDTPPYALQRGGGDLPPAIRTTGLPPQLVAQIRQSPMFGALTAIAQSTVYDATLTTEHARPSGAMAAVTTPALVMTGAQTWPVLAAAARDLTATLPNAR